MNGSAIDVKQLIQRARNEDREALGVLLDRFRPYLQLLAQRELDGLDARIDASDLVQQTCLSAIRNFKQFAGDDEGGFIGWMRVIHERNLRDTIRNNVYTKKRAIGREKPAGDALQQHAISQNRQTSASQRAMRGETAVRLAQCLGEIPEDQREAVRLRYLEGCSVMEISESMGRSEHAIGGLLKRGLKNLRSYLID